MDEKSPELHINEAMVIWNGRLAEKCKYRYGDRCGALLDIYSCNILRCPLLDNANLKIVYKFYDYKERREKYGIQYGK